MTEARPRISLKKAEESVRISLKKKDILEAPTCAVGLALDISGSTTDLYNNQSMANIFTRMLAVAKTFDDNGSMDMWVFNTASHKLEDATEENYENYVDQKIVRKGYVGGGTVYSPCLNSINSHYFPNSKSTTETKKTGLFGKLFGRSDAEVSTESSEVLPAFAIFLTDGENSYDDIRAANKAFEASQDNPIYWLLVGVGKNTSSFHYLKEMGDKYPNVGYLQFDNLDMLDEKLYDGIISQEFVDWISGKK